MVVEELIKEDIRFEEERYTGDRKGSRRDIRAVSLPTGF